MSPVKCLVASKYFPDRVESIYASHTKLMCILWQVDVSTMLEEAVHYVKFLQLQIKVRINKIWITQIVQKIHIT